MRENEIQFSAITLATGNMACACDFYQRIGFHFKYGGPEKAFTSLAFGAGQSLNLISTKIEPDKQFHPGWWGRVIFYVPDVDAFYKQVTGAGIIPPAAPEDGPWGERFFHVTDPDQHELSFATPLNQ